MKTLLALSSALVFAIAAPAGADYSGWTHSGSVYVLTTPEGADLPASASVEDFPLLVRLHKVSSTSARRRGMEMTSDSHRARASRSRIR
jgi:hypothetical protein